MNQSQKRGKPVGVKDKIPQKRKVQEKQVAVYKETIPRKQVIEIIDLSKTYEQNSPENKPLEELSPEEDWVLECDLDTLCTYRRNMGQT